MAVLVEGMWLKFARSWPGDKKRELFNTEGFTVPIAVDDVTLDEVFVLSEDELLERGTSDECSNR